MTFKKRREKLLDMVNEGVAIIPSNNLVTRTNDTEHPFRQNSVFYYFTGFNEANSILVLSNKNGEKKSILFCEEKNPELELWTGKRLGPDDAVKELAVDQTHGISTFKSLIPGLLAGAKSLYMNCFDINETAKIVLNTCDKLWKSRKKSGHLPNKIEHLDVITEKMRLVKEEGEIQFMREAIKKTNHGHRVAMAKTKPGLNERDIHAVMEYTFKMDMGEGPAYGMIIAGGDNANILHYINNNDVLKDGDLLLIDAGAEFGLYASDVTRTFPINGKFTESQKQVYNAVLNAQEAVIKAAKPGLTLKDLHSISSLSLANSLVDLGVLKGKAEDIINSGDIKKYFPHGTGHWLGLDVHDQCPYLDDKANDIVLEENMIFTVEPGLYFSKNDHQIPEKFKGIGIRIEDNILITSDGCENLTKDIPKTISEVERQCSLNYVDVLHQK